MSDVKCPYCGDTGQIRTKGRVKEFRGRKIYEEDASPCICVLNKYLSERFNQFNGIPDAMPRDSIKAAKRYAQDTFKNLTDEQIKKKQASQRFQHRDLIFSGDEEQFFYILKSYFLFFYKYQKFEFLDGLQVVQKYYVEQPNGEYRTLYHLNEFDLLVLSFTSKPNNVAMQDVVLEVIKNRHNLGKPTWIYSPTIEGLRTSKEFSEPLGRYIEAYGKCSVGNSFNYEGFSGGSQVNPASTKKDLSKELANDL
jgi:hypothetical protein